MFADSAYDSAGVYSGNVVISADGSATAIYTGNVDGHQKTYGVCARSTDGLLNWEKRDCMDDAARPNPASPVNWDTQVWREGDAYFALVGGCTYPEPRGTAYLWSAPAPLE